MTHPDKLTEQAGDLIEAVVFWAVLPWLLAKAAIKRMAGESRA